jgi:hypothetical protein
MLPESLMTKRGTPLGSRHRRSWRRQLRRWFRDNGFIIIVVLVLMAVAWLVAEH